MGKVIEQAKDDEQNRIKFAERERQQELDSKMNGLSGETVINKKRDGRVTIETHWHPILKEVIVIESWLVSDGFEELSQEFNVVRSINNIREFIEYARS